MGKQKKDLFSGWDDAGIDEAELSGVPTPESISSEDPSRPIAMAATAAQSSTLGWLDDAIGSASPEMAEDFRNYLKKAKEKFPGDTMAVEMLQPDAIDLVTGGAGRLYKAAKLLAKMQPVKAIKAAHIADRTVPKAGGLIHGAMVEGGKGAASSGATSAISQVGRQEGDKELPDIVETGLSAATGGGARSALGLISNVPSLRKGYMGTSKADLAKKVPAEEAEDVIQKYTDELGQMGMFTSGDKKFDAANLKFINSGKLSKLGKAGNKAKGSVLAPSQKELRKRVRTALDSINEERDRLVAKSTDVDPAQLELLSGPTDIPVGGAFTKESFKMDMEEALDGMHFESLAQREAAKKQMHKQAEILWKEEGYLATLSEMHEVRKGIDARINYEASRNVADPIKEKVNKAMSNALRQRVGAHTTDPAKFEELSRHYSMLSEVAKGLDRKLKVDKKTSKAMGSPSIIVKTMGAMESLGDAGAGVASQISETGQRLNRLSGGAGTRALRKSPDMLWGDEEGEIMDDDSMFAEDEAKPVSRTPQSSSVMPASERLSMNLPKQIMKTKIPRSTEGMQEYSQLFKLKVAQEADNIVRERMYKAGIDTQDIDPMEITRAATELYKNVDTVIEEHPEELGSMLPVWIQQFPSMFEKDRYNRVDGVVPNSMQPLVRDEIRKNPNISNVERIKQLDLLNRTGEYND